VDIIRLEDGARITDCEVTIFVNTSPVPTEEPAQLVAADAEKRGISERLSELALRIEDCLDGYPLSMGKAMEVSGISDLSAVFEWRIEWDDQVAVRYRADIQPELVWWYEYARLRGFFDPELEEFYSTKLLVIARKLPPLLRKVAGSL
jgi:hypothetical protein